MSQRCRGCQRFYEPQLGTIERFLADGVKPPPSRATKDELEQWVTTHTKLLNSLRVIMLQVYASQIHIMSNSGDQK